MSALAVILRCLAIACVIGALLFGFAGRIDIPAFWAYLLVFVVMAPVCTPLPGTI